MTPMTTTTINAPTPISKFEFADCCYGASNPRSAFFERTSSGSGGLGQHQLRLTAASFPPLLIVQTCFFPIDRSRRPPSTDFVINLSSSTSASSISSSELESSFRRLRVICADGVERTCDCDLLRCEGVGAARSSKEEFDVEEPEKSDNRLDLRGIDLGKSSDVGVGSRVKE